MNVGLGLPISDPIVLLDWARRADAGPFSTLGLLDRLVYDNPEPLVTLAALAGATTRIRVQTEVLLAPLRDTVLLAKQCATLDRMSGGRFTLGVGVGGRADDHLAAGYPLRTRGRRLDSQLETLRRIWAGADGIGPAPLRPGGPSLLFGAFRPVALERVARWGDGFLCAAPVDWAGGLFDQVRQSWAAAGRSGSPRLVAQVNVGFSASAREAVARYYGDQADWVLDRMLTTPQQVRAAIARFGDLGADEVMLYCWARDPEQVDQLADLVP